MRMEPLESENQQTESQKTADQNETQKSRPVQPNQAPNKAPAKSGGLFKGFSRPSHSDLVQSEDRHC